MVKAKKYILVQAIEGFPKKTDLRLEEEELPPIKEGEFLAEAVYLSVDPYMRLIAEKVRPGETFLGSQVAKVIESKNAEFPVGTHVVGEFGWRTHTISDGGLEARGFPAPWIIPDLEDLPLSLALGILGMPGNTAYFGFLEILKPKPGDTVVVTGAAGAVGSTVGQIAKIKETTVIGIAGTDEKGKWLIDELKFDHFINYKDKDFEKKLAEVTPNGIDVYFDNVGGQISSEIINRMKPFGRIAVCGGISGYNDKKKMRADGLQVNFVRKQLKMEGFHVHRWMDQWFEGIVQLQKWIKEGKLKYKETVTEGFDNMFEAFVNMLQGGNIGKAIVTV